jgi:hypothetical protein
MQKLPLTEAIEIAQRAQDSDVWKALVQRTDFINLPIAEVVEIAQRAQDSDFWQAVKQRIIILI